MREKLETLPLMQLRELAKSQGIKNITILRKAELIDKLCEVAGGTNAPTAEEVSVQEKEAADKPAEANTEKPAAEPEAQSARPASGYQKPAYSREDRQDRMIEIRDISREHMTEIRTQEQDRPHRQQVLQIRRMTCRI